MAGDTVALLAKQTVLKSRVISTTTIEAIIRIKRVIITVAAPTTVIYTAGEVY